MALDHRDRLNRSMPAARTALLGTWLYDLTNTLNAIVAAGGGPSQAMLDDVDAIRTRYTALRADVTAIRAEVVKLVTDLTATRAEVAKLVTDLGAARTAMNATLAKLDADAGVTGVDYAATNPVPALTAAAPAAITAAAPAAITAAAAAAATATVAEALPSTAVKLPEAR